MRAAVFAVLAFLGFCLISVQAIAAPSITLSPKSGPPGTVVTISGTGFESNKDIDITFEGQATFVTATTGANGSFTAKYTIPSDTQPGQYTITASEHSNPLISASAIFKVETTWKEFHGNDAQHTGVNEHENTIDATNAASLMLKWARKIGTFGTTVTPVVGDGKVWIGGLDGKLYAFNELTGSPAPGFPVQVGNHDDFGRGAPVVTPLGVFIGGEQGWLYGFDPRTGSPLPNYPVQLPSYFFGSLSYDSGNLYVGTFDGKLSAFKARTGMPLPHYPMQLDGGLYGSLTVDNAGHGFIGTSAGSFFGINLSSATTFWSFPAGSVITSTAAYSQGQLFFGADSGNVFGLDATTGSPLTGSPFVTGGPVGSSPAVFGNTICVGSFDKTIQCISRKTLKRIFRRLARSESWGSPQIVNGLLVANDATTVYIYDLSTRLRLWQHAVKIGETSSAAIVNGILYVASSDGFLRAYALPQPKRGGNPSH